MPPPETRDTRYRLLAELGRGGMGTVYLAHVQGPGGFNKLKVVKQLLPDLAEDAHFLAMFMDEARLAARLNHPNIVQTNEIAFDGQNYVIEMEYLEGVTLDVLQRRGSRKGAFPLEFGLYVLAQALAGLQYAHELKSHEGEPLAIVHRDVSPQNIFVTYEGAVKLLDFGIAKAADSSVHTRTGDLRGKVKYMAPEQASVARAKIDRRADLFAVGVILWQFLTGKRLYEGLGDEEILQQLRTSEIPSPKSVKPETPDALDALCTKALARHPDDRIATAEEFQVAIEGYLAQSGTPFGPRQVAAYMTEWFDDRRAAVRAEVDAQIVATNEMSRPNVLVPRLAQAPAIRATITDPSRLAAAPPNSNATKVTAVEGARRSPSRARGAIAGGIVIAIGAGALAWRFHGSTSHPPLPANDAAVLPCATHADCAAAATPMICGAAGTCVASNECTTNRECSARAGHPSMCNLEGRCVAFETEDCHVAAEPGNADDDESLWFGVVMPQKGPAAAAFGTLVTNAIDLARRDFMASTNGIPSRHVGRAPRPIGLVVCDDADLARASRHLVEELHVPAIIGFGGPTELVTIAPLLFAHHVLGLETNSSNALITAVPAPPGEPRLLWRTTGSAANEGKPLASAVAHLIEPRLHPNDPPRVALVRVGNAASLSIAESFVSELRVHGKPIAQEPTAFHQYVYRPDESAAVVDELVAFRPQLIVALNTGFAESIAAPLEAKWPTDVARPLYVFDGTMGDDAFHFLGHSSDRRHRYFAVDFPANTETNVKFALRYNEFFSPKITPGTAPGVAYDALFVLVYAAAAAPDEPITGASLSRGIAKLVPGPGRIPIDVGGAATFRAFGALREGGAIDLNGAGTPLDFDLTTGETAADYAIYCAHVDAHGTVDDAIESGARYSAAKNDLLGTMTCH